MAQHYSDPRREAEATALPDVETFQMDAVECGECDYSGPKGDEGRCPECNAVQTPGDITQRNAWWYWYCLPGCLPDSDPFGPYATEEEALAEARAEYES